jgi:general transcription factor 3C polypeptide 3 (transcription factor C subunit 4)
MFPRHRRRRGETEADEDNMASRLQLDLGMLYMCQCHRYLLLPRTYSLTRKSARNGQKGDAVDNFRGVSFDDWLRLIMQVSRSIFGGCI